MLGSHLSIAGGLCNALHQARRLGMECVQVFTRNQRQWASPPLRDEEISLWQRALDELNWSKGLAHGLARVVSHNSYLINLASPDDEIWKKCIASQRAEIERCETLGIPRTVTHPGAHLLSQRDPKSANDLTSKPSRDELRGLKRIAKALDAIHRQLPGCRTITCLETTVGSGTNLGFSFHHLALIRSLVRQPERVAFCMDTCHVTAAGYDMSTRESAAATLDEFDQVCGLENLLVIHLNDSVAPLGSRRDRHAHIGKGTCGKSCFQAVLNHPALASVPMILETPKGCDDKGVDLDLINLRTLRRLRVITPRQRPGAIGTSRRILPAAAALQST